MIQPSTTRKGIEMATDTRTHDAQEAVTIITATLPDGKNQEFVQFDQDGGRVEAMGRSWTAKQWEDGKKRMQIAGASFSERPGFAWGIAK